MQTLRRLAVVSTVLLVHASVAPAQQTITFSADPFTGSTALTTPGRQIVGNELFTTFDPATDVFVFDPAVYGAYGIGSLSFAIGAVGSLPTTGVNTLVLAPSPIPFAAGTAANEIAARLTTSGAGFFVYFNSGLDVPRLVFSTDLNDENADLRVLARLTNLSGQGGRDALATFSSANFAVAVVPEPSSVLMLAAGLAAVGAHQAARRHRAGITARVRRT
ncbi:PEP-CTERM sorting domain-containing protein [Roseisolibacter agri]|uniref:Ice-binding protein C-terminal domain-containing protein n=1 Tax=Roseisolibacter agri TaxID=2014610 RepID=A0AA37Q5D4_9BACT|nr:PEP-CTERM sorting domain-containing protein [Roseisolibacter agri]GLC26900.1 hypothetical protein rosag_34130 [Roseisolibacter agri]